MKRNNVLCLLLIWASIMCSHCSNQEVSIQQSRVEHLPYYQEASFSPHWMLPTDQHLDTFHQISSFQLINQEGETITDKTVEGKIYVADFFFTFCPGICPKMTKNMAVLQEAFMDDKDIVLLSHSVTPQHDSVSVLKEYARNNGIISSKWHLLTGSQAEIYRLARKDYFVEEALGQQKEEDEFLHTENFVLIDKKGYIRGIYNGLRQLSIQRLIADIQTLKQE